MESTIKLRFYCEIIKKAREYSKQRYTKFMEMSRGVSGKEPPEDVRRMFNSISHSDTKSFQEGAMYVIDEIITVIKEKDSIDAVCDRLHEMMKPLED